MNQTPAPARARKPRLSLWFALAFILALIGWYEWAAQSVPRAAPSNSAAASVADGNHQVAIFAGGCFWCVESDFDKVPGVISTTSGYTGGKTANPSYAEVSSHTTDHAEAVKIVFDPVKVSYRQLVDHFWHTIDPTVRDRQFCDIGSPYRTVIFATSAEQLAQAQASRAALETNKPFTEPIVTDIRMADDFYPAEDEHQDYYKKNPVRYDFYRTSCGRDARLKSLWGNLAGK